MRQPDMWLKMCWEIRGWVLQKPWLKTPLIFLIWMYHVVRFRHRYFYFQGEKYAYFFHPYNYTWLGERTVEIPLIRKIINSYSDKSVLEVGNVLSHYFPISHDIVDKYEKAPRVINQDIISYHPQKQYDLIVSISTLEHVGWDETPRNPRKVLAVLTHLKRLLKPGGKLVFTWPMGYNKSADIHLKKGRFHLSKKSCFVRFTKDNQWQQCQWKNIKSAHYGSPYHCANGLVMGIIDKPS